MFQIYTTKSPQNLTRSLKSLKTGNSLMKNYYQYQSGTSVAEVSGKMFRKSEIAAVSYFQKRRRKLKKNC